MRENCFKNEKKNLAIEFKNLQAEQEEFKKYAQELIDLKHVVEEAKKEEQAEKLRTIELEKKIKELSVYYQKETQNLKRLENDMYKRLISQKIQDFSRETYGYSILQRPYKQSVVEEPPISNEVILRILPLIL